MRNLGNLLKTVLFPFQLIRVILTVFFEERGDWEQRSF